MKKNINVGMVVVLSVSAVSSAKTISAENKLNNNNSSLNNDYNIFNEYSETDEKVSDFNISQDSENDAERNIENMGVKITTIDKSKKINSGKIVTEKIHDKVSDEVISSSAIKSGEVDFKLKFKKPDSREDFSINNYVDVTDINTSGSAIEVNLQKIPYVKFDVSLGDIIIKKSNCSSTGVIVEQNENEIFVYNGKQIMLLGNTSRYGVYIENNVDTDIILNGVSVSSENGISVEKNSDINFKIIDNSLNTIKKFYNNGQINIYGETGNLITGELNGKVGIFGGIVKATENCDKLSEIIVKECSADIKTEKIVKSNLHSSEALECNIINIDGINCQPVEVNVNGEAFVSKTDINGNLYLFLPKRDNKVIIKNENTAFIVNTKKYGNKHYTAKKIPAISRVDVEVSQTFRNDNMVDAEFKVKIPENMKYSDDLKIGVQCFDSGWLLDDEISEKNIAKVVKDEKSEYYTLSIKELSENKSYKCRVFSVVGENIEFSDVMEFKTKSAEEDRIENSFDEIKISGFSKEFNSLEQNIDVLSDVDYEVIYFENGIRMNKAPINAGKYIAKVIVNDKEHEYFEKNFEFIIEKAVPQTAELPVATNVIKGNKISVSKLFGGVINGADGELEGNFKWKDNDKIIENSREYIAEFVPYDKNYLSVEFNVLVEADEEKHIDFVYMPKEYIKIEEGKLLVLKTEAVSNDGKAIIYQWYKNGKAIDGAVSGILVKNDVSKADTGEYFVAAKTLDGYSVQCEKCYIDVIEKNNDIKNNDVNEDDIGLRKSAGNVKRNNKNIFINLENKNEIDDNVNKNNEDEKNNFLKRVLDTDDKSKSDENNEDEKKNFLEKVLDTDDKSESDENNEDEKKNFLEKVLDTNKESGSNNSNEEEKKNFLKRILDTEKENESDEDNGSEKKNFLKRVMDIDDESKSDVDNNDKNNVNITKKKNFLQRVLDSDKENLDEEISETEEVVYSLVKRITDGMLIEIYGKVSYPDDNTVAVTTPYVAYGTDGNKTVFQLDENGCFGEVNAYRFKGGEVSVITDRDFPLIVGRSKEYSDVKYYWNDEDIKFVSSFDIMPGQGNNFNPEKNVTRGDFIEALYNLAGKPQYSVKMEYYDVPEGGRYYDSINWAYEQGLIKGRSDDEFGINLNVTREQAAVVLSKYIERMGFNLSNTQKGYSDSQNISDWAVDDVYKISNTGIMSDLGYGRFQPKAFCSRAEVATLLKKTIQYKLNF